MSTSRGGSHCALAEPVRSDRLPKARLDQERVQGEVQAVFRTFVGGLEKGAVLGWQREVPRLLEEEEGIVVGGGSGGHRFNIPGHGGRVVGAGGGHIGGQLVEADRGGMRRVEVWVDHQEEILRRGTEPRHLSQLWLGVILGAFGSCLGVYRSN